MLGVSSQSSVSSSFLELQHRLGLREMTYRAAFQSDVGQKRLENQDVAEVFSFRGGVLSVVCDGMGGYRGGEVASRLAVDTIIRYFQALPLASLDAPFQRLEEAIQWANRSVWEHAQSHPEMSKMGTTVVAALCYKNQVYVAHVGDSRMYLLREGALLRVTRDHSRVQRLVDEGKIKEEEAENHPSANVISRVLGQFPNVNVECQPAPIRLAEHDRLLLCSDGLVRMVSEQDILLLMSEDETPEVSCQQLVDRANHAGGKDNITVCVIGCSTQPRMWMWCAYGCYVVVLLGLFLHALFAVPVVHSSQDDVRPRAVHPNVRAVHLSTPLQRTPIDASGSRKTPNDGTALSTSAGTIPIVLKRPVVRKRPTRRVKRKKRRRRRRYRRRRRRQRRYRRRRHRRTRRYRRRSRRKRYRRTRTRHSPKRR